ncbi:hypothetical protein PG997_001950 [Apiospora hydei]|uniref:Uncharacterized protein n=1 Tax=Apiospora hydei TaxID=1337664 RepID=A0ABR1X839_9PEZI
MTSVGAVSKSQKPKTKIGGVYRSQVPKTIIATGCASGVVRNDPSCPILPHTSDLTVETGPPHSHSTSLACIREAPTRPPDPRSLQPDERASVRRAGDSTYPHDEELDYLPLDYLFLNADTAREAGPSTHGSKWCDAHIVNHLGE